MTQFSVLVGNKNTLTSDNTMIVDLVEHKHHQTSNSSSVLLSAAKSGTNPEEQLVKVFTIYTVTLY